MKRRFVIALVMAAAVSATGCLQKETRSTIYLRSDGSFDWVVVELHVRSDEAKAEARTAEELGYVDAVARDAHPVAESFRLLGSRDVRTQLLRDVRPYAVMVDARFDSLSRMADGQLAGCGVPYEVSQTVEGDVTTWRLWADIGADGDNLADNVDCLAGFGGLIDADHLTIVLLDGTFTKAEGFALSGGDVATSNDAATSEEALKTHNGQLVLSLSWKAAR
jgi:hypothetical protein